MPRAVAPRPSVTDTPTPSCLGGRSRWRRLAGRLARLSTTGLIVAAITGLLYEAVSTSLDARRYPPLGELVDVGGYRLHLHCRGSDGPTVVLEAGLGRDVLDWSWVQPGLAKHTRTCAYDRAGAGWSDPGPKPRDSRRIASELRTLLIRAGIDRPVVLVGHSAGGSHIQVFQHLYPDAVAGMVLIDVSHRAEPIQTAPPRAMVALAKALRAVDVLRVFGWMDGNDLPPAAQAMENALMYRPDAISTIVAENQAVDANRRDVREISGAGSLGALPLVVITAAGEVEDQPRPPGMSLDAARRDLALRHQLQRRLLTLSTDSRQVLAEHSGHQVHKDQPELVITEIAELVESLRRADRDAADGDITEPSVEPATISADPSIGGETRMERTSTLDDNSV
ncbi:MAG: alpha/beta hydrolase [Acidobacteriota bacterium]